MNSFEMTRRFHEAFGFNIPSRPIEPTVEDRILRAKLLLEETMETIQKGLGVALLLKRPMDSGYLFDASDVYMECLDPYDPVETLDGIADVKVVANGTGVLFGLPVDVADRLVFESNMSKLDENGKPIVNACKHCGGNSPGVYHDCELMDPTQPVGKVLKSDRHKKVDLTGLLESLCDGHTASSHDPKICGKCATHIDGLRP